MFGNLVELQKRWMRSSPLRHRVFRFFYFGSIGSALGYTMQGTVAAWLMATLTPSPLMVALVQTATTLPTLIFGLVSGTLADIVERRKILLVTQGLLIVGTITLGLFELADWVNPMILLVLTFLVGMGFTFYLPAQQASINDLVPSKELHSAVALGAVAFNVARAVGPALAGALAAWMGSGSALLASACCFVAMLHAARKVKPAASALPGVPERLVSGVISGIRFVRHTPGMRTIVFRNFGFAVCASAFWALLPVIARDQLKLGAGGFGLLSAGFGIGAIVGAFSVPAQLKKKSLHGIVVYGSVLWALAVVLLVVSGWIAFAVMATFTAGVAWVSVFASLSAGTQTTAPAWVRARAVATNLVSVQASLGVGSIIWGALATAIGLKMTLAASAAVMLLVLAFSHRVRVSLGSESDVKPGFQLPELVTEIQPMADDGPILIQVQYQVAAENREAFLKAIRSVEPTRRRNGALSWRVFADLEKEGRFVERYIVASWAEYIRLRSRATVGDRMPHVALEQYQEPGVEIRVSRLIGVDLKELPLTEN